MSEFIVLSKDGAEVMRPGGIMGKRTEEPLIFYSADLAYAACEALNRDDLTIHQHEEPSSDDAPECPPSGCRIRR